jgi:hypothetical protein
MLDDFLEHTMHVPALLVFRIPAWSMSGMSGRYRNATMDDMETSIINSI